jgi:hypothetical protein
MKDPQHPRSHHPDGQPSNPSHGDMQHHVGVHPSRERAFNRAEAPVEVHHHEAEPHDPAATERDHRERSSITFGGSRPSTRMA